MPSIIACDHASMSSKRILVRPVTSFRHSADSGSASALQRSARPEGANASRMRSAWAWNCRTQVSRTVRGDTAGNIAARSDMCASPSLRIMLWPIRRFINPAGWCEENTSMRFSWVKMSSRRVKTVEPSCGTNAIGASFRYHDRAGDEGRQIGGEEDRGPDDVLRLAGAAERGVVHEDLDQVRIAG